MVSSWSHDLFNGPLTYLMKHMEKPLCLIAYAKSLRRNNLAWSISAFAGGFARLRAPAKHSRNAFAAKVGTALLTKSLHPKKKRCSNGLAIDLHVSPIPTIFPNIYRHYNPKSQLQQSKKRCQKIEDWEKWSHDHRTQEKTLRHLGVHWVRLSTVQSISSSFIFFVKTLTLARRVPTGSEYLVAWIIRQKQYGNDWKIILQ